MKYDDDRWFFLAVAVIFLVFGSCTMQQQYLDAKYPKCPKCTRTLMNLTS